jgi:alkanesulfonate monooxygenase
MPVEMIGWIAPRVSSEIIPPSGPPFDAGVIAETARIHERAGFDRVLIGYFSDAPDGFLVGAHAASVTKRLSFLLAHRPGFVAPPLAARKLATLDQLSDGRLAVHIISGGSDADQAKDGDWTDHEARYRRSAEYISLLRRSWTEPAPFDHQGEFYRTRGTYSEIRCRQEPHIPIYGGGGSDAACRCLHAVGRAAEGHGPVHGPGPTRGGALRPRPDLQPVNPADPGGDGGRSLGPGEGHP